MLFVATGHFLALVFRKALQQFFSIPSACTAPVMNGFSTLADYYARFGEDKFLIIKPPNATPLTRLVHW
jgi:hypothetical protein